VKLEIERNCGGDRTAFAEKVHVDRQLVDAWTEKRTQKPHRETIRKLRAALGDEKTDWLLSGKGSGRPQVIDAAVQKHDTAQLSQKPETAKAIAQMLGVLAKLGDTERQPGSSDPPGVSWSATAPITVGISEEVEALAIRYNEKSRRVETPTIKVPKAVAAKLRGQGG
jgi:transcriptional regulator with XRE-family HTH domain